MVTVGKYNIGCRGCRAAVGAVGCQGCRDCRAAVGIMSGASVGVSGQGSVATAPKALATAPKALATAPKALAPRICLEGACQRPKFSKGRHRRAFGQWGPSARLAISCATLAARTRPWKTHPPREWWSGMSSCLSSCLHSCSVPYQSRQLTYPLVTRIRTRRGLLAGGKVQSGAERSRAEPSGAGRPPIK